MAKKVTVDLVDDFDPDLQADETVSFGLDNVTYEIDLSEGNARQLRSDLDKWVEVARRVSGRQRTRSVSAAIGGGLPLAEIREWAQENGHNVANRGRVSAEVVRAWNKRDESPAPAPAKKAPAKKAAPKQQEVTEENGIIKHPDPSFSDKGN